MKNFNVGDLVYYDSMRGLVKGKIIEIIYNDDLFGITPSKAHLIKIRVTSKNHPIYKLGDIIESSRLWVIPRDRVYIRSGQYRIKSY